MKSIISSPLCGSALVIPIYFVQKKVIPIYLSVIFFSFSDQQQQEHWQTKPMFLNNRIRHTNVIGMGHTSTGNTEKSTEHNNITMNITITSQFQSGFTLSNHIKLLLSAQYKTGPALFLAYLLIQLFIGHINYMFISLRCASYIALVSYPTLFQLEEDEDFQYTTLSNNS